ncbi:MAG: flagellar assembly protein FliH [Myxococcaceae bacterium]|nr:flagellar assembly protein FliH [Myxococcaceae bacterium]
MSPLPSPPHAPRFLAEVPRRGSVEAAQFPRLESTLTPLPLHLPRRPGMPSSPPLTKAAPMPGKVAPAPPPSLPDKPSPSVEVPRPRASPQPDAAYRPPDIANHNTERLVSAIQNLRLQSERLAEQARSDALELGFQVARRILEAELTTSPQPLFGLIRSAVQRLGESRRVVIHVSPGDLARVEDAGGKGTLGLAVAQVDLVADATLQTGDCVIDGDFGSVDGRITTRLDELRREVAEVIEGELA